MVTRLSAPTLVPSCDTIDNEVTEAPRRTTSEGLTVVLPLTIRGVDARFIVDTGAAVTIISSYVYNILPAMARPKFREPDVTHLTVAVEKRMQIDSVATFTFQAHGQFFGWDMYVAPIKEHGLLVLDFLFTQDFMMNTDTLHLNGQKVACELHVQATLSAARVTVAQDTVIPDESQFDGNWRGSVDISSTFSPGMG